MVSGPVVQTGVLYSVYEKSVSREVEPIKTLWLGCEVEVSHRKSGARSTGAAAVLHANAPSNVFWSALRVYASV